MTHAVVYAAKSTSETNAMVLADWLEAEVARRGTSSFAGLQD